MKRSWRKGSFSAMLRKSFFAFGGRREQGMPSYDGEQERKQRA
ncbi:MAG: hypothetical protein K0S39_4761, partial [Paenibacillus sp.]|nr:hypothetical protein [Paenibacillus sp.]